MAKEQQVADIVRVLANQYSLASLLFLAAVDTTFRYAPGFDLYSSIFFAMVGLVGVILIEYRLAKVDRNLTIKKWFNLIIAGIIGGAVVALPQSVWGYFFVIALGSFKLLSGKK